MLCGCSLRVTGYPYVALLAFSGSRTQLIAAVEGPTPAARLLAVLQQAVNDHGGHLAVEQADANERVSQNCPLLLLEQGIRFVYRKVAGTIFQAGRCSEDGSQAAYNLKTCQRMQKVYSLHQCFCSLPKSSASSYSAAILVQVLSLTSILTVSQALGGMNRNSTGGCEMSRIRRTSNR